MTNNWRQKFIEEVARAEEAQREGNAGRARTAARRAANVVLQEYIRRIDPAQKRGTIQENGLRLLHTPHLHPEVYLILRHMLMRVGRDYAWPQDIDLVAEARRLSVLLLEEEINGRD